MVSIYGEPPLTLEQAAAECIGNCGKPAHPETLRRWITKGVNGVKLEHKRQGRRYLIFRSALRRFIDTLSSRDSSVDCDDGYLAAQQALRERHGLVI